MSAVQRSVMTVRSIRPDENCPISNCGSRGCQIVEHPVLPPATVASRLGLGMHSIIGLEERAGEGHEFSVAGMVERLNAGDLPGNIRMCPLQIRSQLLLG